MINVGSSNFIIAIPEIYLAIVAILILFVGLYINPNENSNKVILFSKTSSLSIMAIFLGLVLTFAIGDVYVESFYGLYVISPMIFIFKVIIIFFVLITLILARVYLIDKGINQFEYLSLVIFFLVGNLLMISSNDFMSFYVSLELTTICIYILMFIEKGSVSSYQSGIKYFLLGGLGTAFLLYGISLVYGYTGLTNFMYIKNYIKPDTNNWILLVGLVMVIVGVGFKLSLVPFHMWTPDVYKGTNKFMLLMLSVVSKFSVLFIFIRILWEPFLHLSHQWVQIIQILIIISALIGFIVSIYQTNIKSFVAYSSIANISYVLLISLNPSVLAIKNLVIYVLSYGIALVGFISTIMLFKRNNKSIVDIYDLKGIYKGSPYLAFILSTFLLSMAGLPITAGFFGKIFVLYATFIEGNYMLGSAISLLSVIMMYFYLKVIKIMYFDSYEDAKIEYYSSIGNISFKITLACLFLFTLLFIIVLSPLSGFLDNIILVL